MTQQSVAEVQRRRNIKTLGFLGALSIAAGLAVFSGPGGKQVAPEPSAPVARPPAKPVAPAKPAAQAARPPAKPSPPLIDEKVVWDDPPEWKRLTSSGMRYAS